jgi:sigma-B regulation protein RsbU (phosphoserine phosphatase)
MSATPTETPARRSVLVVDDEPGMRYTARRILEARYDVIEAASGEDAIDRFGERPFNIALVDLRLPGQSGLELLSSIKVMSPATDVVIMTGSAKDPEEALLGSIRRKAFFFLRKPFSAAVLETLVDRITETQTLEERVLLNAQRLEEDLENARKFQIGLLPPREWKGRRIEVAGLYVPSARLSGDLIDYWTLPGGGTALLAADVMGHGASAAMMTGIVKTQLRSLASQETDPAGILLELDAALRGLTIHRFLTILLVIDEGASGGIRYCGAGHPPGILRTPDGAILPLESDGPPLNILGLDPYPRHSEILPRVAGSRIFICTDGFADAESLDGARLNESPDFRAVVEQALQLPPVPARARLDEMLAAHIRGKDQEDDRALLVAELR